MSSSDLPPDVREPKDPQDPGVRGRCAAATLLTSSDYVVGARVTGLSLRRSGWDHETIALITPNIAEPDRQRLRRYWDTLIEVEPIANPAPPEARGLPYYDSVYTKLHLWNQTEYTKLVFLDADTVVTGPLGELLERGEFAAAPCMTAPDQFNSGVLVLEPSRKRFDDMASKVGKLSSYDGSDQGYLNAYFPAWYSGPAEVRLPQKFNVPRLLFNYGPAWSRLRADMRVLHYIGPHKPWKRKTHWRKRAEEARRARPWWRPKSRRLPPDPAPPVPDEPFRLWLEMKALLEP